MAEEGVQKSIAAADENRDVKITLHWLDKSRSQRILWLLEELKAPYDIKVYKRGEDMLAPASLKSVHPLGKSPTIEITAPGLERPLVLAESGAIVEYLTEHFGDAGNQLVPKKWKDGQEGKMGGETEDWLRYRFLMHYAEGSLMTLMVVALVVKSIRTAPVPFFLKPITRAISSRIEASFLAPNFETHLSFLEEQLATSGGDYFCGPNLSGADILMVFPLEAGGSRAGMTNEKYPKLTAYVERLQKREAYERARKRIEEEAGEELKASL